MNDVIVASATAWAPAALAVVRLSGPGLGAVLTRFVRPHAGWPIPPGRARRIDVFDREGIIDDGLAVLGRAPATYTGEPTAELTVHGNPVLVRRILDAAVAAGARVARRGEFTRRAVLHGKLDLVQAEAVLQVAEAVTRRGADAARAGLSGDLSDALAALREPLLIAAAELEARLDLPGDELTLEDDAALGQRLTSVSARARALAATYDVGHLWVHGARVALVGTVNAGKSSLFNALLGRRRALVHEEPGTTRDVLEMRTELGGLPVTLLDTAGERVTADPVEAAGLALAKELVGEADAVIVVLRARAAGLSDVERTLLERTEGRPRIVVYNGVDDETAAMAPAGSIRTVATTGSGVEQVGPALAAALHATEPRSDALMIASARQRDALLAVASSADEAVAELPIAGPAVAAELVVAALEEIDALTGADTREGVLDTLFARFCIGK